MESGNLKTPLSNLQLELLNVISSNVDEKDLVEIKKMIGQYFAKKAIRLADAYWDEKKWTRKNGEKMASTRMRSNRSAKK